MLSMTRRQILTLGLLVADEPDGRWEVDATNIGAAICVKDLGGKEYTLIDRKGRAVGLPGFTPLTPRDMEASSGRD